MILSLTLCGPTTKASQKFCNILVMWNNSAPPNIFVEVIGLWDVKVALTLTELVFMTWSTASESMFLCLLGCQGSYNQEKFLKPSAYCTVISCTFSFLVASTALDKFLKHKFLNVWLLHVHLCIFQIAYGVKQCTMLAHQLLQYYQPH